MVEAQPTVALVALGVYMILAIPTLFTALSHGYHFPAALLGWAWLFFFCMLKISGNAMYLRDATSSFSATSIIGSIVLAYLVLAVMGILREVRLYAFPIKPRETKITLVAEILVVVAMVLLAIGASDMAADYASSMPDVVFAAKMESAYLKALIGTGILVVVFFCTGVMAVASLLRWPKDGSAPAAAFTLAVGVVATLPSLGVRLGTSLVFWVRRDSTLDPFDGDTKKTLGLVVWQEIMVVVILLVTGLLTRDLSRKANG